MPQVLCYASIVFYTGHRQSPLLASEAILIIGFYNTMCQTFVFEFMRTVNFVINASVSMDRIKVRPTRALSVRSTDARIVAFRLKTYLLGEELRGDIARQTEAKGDAWVRVDGLSAGWDEQSCSLRNISFEVASKQIVGVIGPVGSGKSSLLMALLGEMPYIKSAGNQMNGSVFYVPQEPWIFPATVKENILFGKEFTKAKFDEIVDICSLRNDLDLLSGGEDTLIGERGANLSGGQRVRISLARALYSDADIYLLDDPLSAVDANVARHLYNE